LDSSEGVGKCPERQTEQRVSLRRKSPRREMAGKPPPAGSPIPGVVKRELVGLAPAHASIAAFDTFYNSSAYQKLRAIRDECSSVGLVAVEGLEQGESLDA
jgi:Domain of unknown function (DUF1330)